MVTPMFNTNAVKHNFSALKYLILPFFLAFFMFVTLNESLSWYLIGQFCGGIFLAQSFILLHEAGHESFFNTKILNTILGRFFSFLVFIPYYNWVEIHELHHKWAGWRNLDPTTENTFSNQLTNSQKKVINFCWKYYIPLFTLAYRFSIYWKAEKLKRHLVSKKYQKSIFELYIYGVFYLVTIFLFPSFYLSILPAIFLSFIITDYITLSQHSSIKMLVSKGSSVEPIKLQEQPQYSRSLIFPDWISQYILFNFNYHEAHHAYPKIPGHMLHKVKKNYTNSYHFLPWFKAVKSISGVNFIFTASSSEVNSAVNSETNSETSSEVSNETNSEISSEKINN